VRRAAIALGRLAPFVIGRLAPFVIGRLAPPLAAALAAGCTVGSGAGSAAGPMFIVGCDKAGDFATPACFNLQPSFFAGEPIEDINRGTKSNRLLIRIQRTGNRIEINDVVYFDIRNSFEVARCLRGQLKPDGTPDWDTREVISIKEVCTGVPWCDWSARAGTPPSSCVGVPGDAGIQVTAPVDAGALATALDGGAASCTALMHTAPAGPPRPLIHFGPQEFIRGSFVPRFTCSDERIDTVNLSATAVDGWIDFLDFGGVQSFPVLGSDYKVDFGSRLQANFHMVLQDDRVLNAIMTFISIPDPLIGGELDGFFDFDLERGRAAQPFP
jgi:hypothetical protein